MITLLKNTRSTESAKNNFENMNWLSLAFLPSIWKIERDFHLKLSAAISKHVTIIGWSPMSNAYKFI